MRKEHVAILANYVFLILGRPTSLLFSSLLPVGTGQSAACAFHCEVSHGRSMLEKSAERGRAEGLGAGCVFIAWDTEPVHPSHGNLSTRQYWTKRNVRFWHLAGIGRA